MKYKKIIWTFFVTLMVLSLLFFSMLYVDDPLKIFHKPWHHKTYLETNMREQAAGIINNWEFNSIILGTSMLENTSAQEASEELGGKFVNISLAGSTYLERKILLEYTLKTKKIKTVLYSLDKLGTLGQDLDANLAYKTSNWDYLYDTNPLNDFKIYLNDRYLKCIFTLNETKNCIGEKVDFDRPTAWYKSIFHFYLFGGLDHWFKVKKNWLVISSAKNILKGIREIKAGHIKYDDKITQKILASRKYIDNTIISTVAKYPDITFLYIIPPYSRMEFAIWAQYEKNIFALHKMNLKYIVQQSSKYPNMQVYAWGREDFLDDISNYQDLSHYEYKINSWELKAISEQKGLLSLKNIDFYLNDITKKALHYNILQYEKKFEDFLRP